MKERDHLSYKYTCIARPNTIFSSSSSKNKSAKRDLVAEMRRVEEADQVAAAHAHHDKKPDASSLSKELEQALQTKDNSMLEYCLSTALKTRKKMRKVQKKQRNDLLLVIKERPNEMLPCATFHQLQSSSVRTACLKYLYRNCFSIVVETFFGNSPLR